MDDLVSNRSPDDESQAPENSPAPDLSRAEGPARGERLPPQLEAVFERIELVREERTSPLPSADEYRQYAEIIPNGAERIMKMAEKEQDFQHERGRRQEFRATLGVSSALGIVIVVCILCGYGFSAGHPVEAAAIFGATLASIVGVFIRGTSIGQKTDESKSNEDEK